jgi:hypothetical protein
MAETPGDPSGLTVGSLLGLPLGVASTSTTPGAPRASASAKGHSLLASEIEGENWAVDGGEVSLDDPRTEFRPDGVEALDFNNPFNQTMERVWFDGKIVYAIDCGELDVDLERVKVAQEYQVVYAVALDEQGKLAREPEMVPGQFNIYDSVPGMDKYSPIWQFNYVIVPRDYRVNSIRSESDCLTSGYAILHSTVFEN